MFRVKLNIFRGKFVLQVCRPKEVVLQFSDSCTAETALQHSLFCSADVAFTNWAATKEKLHCNIEKLRCRKVGAFLPLSCGFQAPTFRHPRLGPMLQGCHPSSPSTTWSELSRRPRLSKTLCFSWLSQKVRWPILGSSVWTSFGQLPAR